MNLWRIPIDETSGRTRGDPKPLAAPAPWAAHASMSADGTRLAYSSVLQTTNIQRLSFDPIAASITGEDGWVTTGSRVWSGPIRRQTPSGSRSTRGSCLKATSISRGLDEKGLVVYSVRTNRYERLTDLGEWPVWLPDSRRLLFVSRGKEFHVIDTQKKQTRKIYSSMRDVLGPPQLSRDGRAMYFSRRVTESDIWTRTLK